MAIITEAHKQKVRELFDKELVNSLEILFFVAEPEGEQFTDATREVLTELAGLSAGRLTIREIDLGAGEAATYGVDKAPALVFLDQEGRDQGFRFYGAPVGYEFMALLDDIVDVSKGKTRLSEAVRAKIRGISQDVLIQVFSTPG